MIPHDSSNTYIIRTVLALCPAKTGWLRGLVMCPFRSFVQKVEVGVCGRR